MERLRIPFKKRFQFEISRSEGISVVFAMVTHLWGINLFPFGVWRMPVGYAGDGTPFINFAETRNIL